MEPNYKSAYELLERYNQTHLLNCYENMDEIQKEELLRQVLSIDFELVKGLYENTKKEIEVGEGKIEQLPHMDRTKFTKEQNEYYINIGEEEIKSGKLAVVTMAGGQGTRLGHKGPKGTFDLGLESHKSLFELLCDTLKKASKKYNVTIRWYIMTSRENNKETVEFFKEREYFGYPQEAISFFIQGELPMVGTNGKILLEENGFVKLAADGHGGIFEALIKSGSIEDMKKKGTKWIFIAGVDNVLANMVDPIFIGVIKDNGHLAGSKSLVKVPPTEKIGTFCKKDGKPYVIEYTEISEEMANKTDESGELIYGEGHILLNMFHISAIEDLAKNKLPYHIAFKKADYLDENGNIVKPNSPNAYKFESFIFDAFSTLKDMTILRTVREDEFAPVKNATGVDSAQSAKELYINYTKRRNSN